MTAAMWLVTATALAGNVFIVRRMRVGFALWIVSNTALIARNAQLGEWPQTALFAAYLVLAVWGWFTWRPQHRSARQDDDR